MFAAPFALLALVAPAFATVFVTSPVATTTFTGGQVATISWQDSGSAPTLQDFGASKVSIYVGNAQQQTSLQLIQGSVDVSTTSTIQFTPDATIGPDDGDYFIRFESLALKDATSPQYPALAFSAKFTMAGMSGTFNSTVQAQIAGQSTAPLAGQTTAASSTGSSSGSSTGSSAATLTTSKIASSTGTTTKTGTSASSTASHSAALGLKAGWAGIALSALIGVTAF